MERRRIAIIGAGQIGKHHLNEYHRVGGADIVAICDINEAEARRVAEANRIPHVYADFRELLKRDDIEAVDVCLHNNFHAPVSIAAMEAGKHVYCEKPIAGSYRDGAAMLESARVTGKMLHIQLSTLYSKETKAAKTLIDGGKLGKLYHARSTGFRRRGRPFVDGYGTTAFTQKATASGGALYDMGVYHISQILYLLGLPTVTRISGQTYQEMDMLPDRREMSKFDVEELGVGLIKFEGGITLDIIEAWAIHLGGFEGSSIVGSEGGIRMPARKGDHIQPFTYHSTVLDLDLDTVIDLNAMDRRRHLLNPNEWAYDSSQGHWIAALSGIVPLLPTAELALNTMLISEGIYMSGALGREVTAEEVAASSVSSAIRL
ncbi:MAG: Gfo/Idh/MocA family oxidoreductase [Paenibacillus dendritiformis]|uniref:Gfo/Idh/MocA family protein n=1 Tax=Paenibacillus dendritiformis TaxID=130049 RepID=UPI00143D690C|nr:Gfo/Idh/MocA family oxidoreductase [Paenibacillus dendritiformis]MDU5142375.1 Gfo/Idh/MocA family oxidoreductase [Paenibacillus dendritiformis]NKI21031.1 Gfo/Idh/MocA family oxidoreductase [Paenibacillus dendritiformis]NRF98148.1 Gfo/Idh/MocA family oxidoreductase [Paenibacillus dendritiformis]